MDVTNVSRTLFRGLKMFSYTAGQQRPEPSLSTGVTCSWHNDPGVTAKSGTATSELCKEFETLLVLFYELFLFFLIFLWGKWWDGHVSSITMTADNYSVLCILLSHLTYCSFEAPLQFNYLSSRWAIIIELSQSQLNHYCLFHGGQGTLQLPLWMETFTDQTMHGGICRAGSSA